MNNPKNLHHLKIWIGLFVLAIILNSCYSTNFYSPYKYKHNEDNGYRFEDSTFSVWSSISYNDCLIEIYFSVNDTAFTNCKINSLDCRLYDAHNNPIERIFFCNSYAPRSNDSTKGIIPDKYMYTNMVNNKYLRNSFTAGFDISNAKKYRLVIIEVIEKDGKATLLYKEYDLRRHRQFYTIFGKELRPYFRLKDFRYWPSLLMEVYDRGCKK